LEQIFEKLRGNILGSRDPFVIIAAHLLLWGGHERLLRDSPHHVQGGIPMSRTRIPLSRQDEQARLMKERLEMSTAEIGLTVRTTNCLEERGIFTVRDLLNSTPDQLLSIANFGEKTLEEVYKSLEQFGFYRASRQKALV
jgi:DNA-directed RNA polymerase subunit alpha